MSLRDTLRRLAAVQPAEAPFLSVHLNLAPQGSGVLTYPVFWKKRFAEELRRFPERSAVHAGLARIRERIQHHLEFDLPPGMRAVAFFARSGAGEFFEVVHLPIAFPSHALVLSARPYLYPLAAISDRYPCTVAAVVDSNTARLFVVSLAQVVARRELHGEHLHRPHSGGLSQARIQRHVEDHYLHHAKSTAAALDRLVREHDAAYVLVGGDEVILPDLRLQLSSIVRERLLAEPHWDIRIAEHDLVADAMGRVRRALSESRSRRTAEILDAVRARGHATAGVPETLWALGQGKVTELIMAEPRNGDAWVDHCPRCGRLVEDASATACPSCGSDELREELLCGLLVNEALAHGGEVRVVETHEELARAGGVAAALRYR